VLQGKGVYCEGKYRPAGILLIGNVVINFRFKLLMEFRNNKNYSSKILNIHTGVFSKYMSIRLIFRKNKRYHE
jgi:hypothetical protein